MVGARRRGRPEPMVQLDEVFTWRGEVEEDADGEVACLMRRPHIFPLMVWSVVC
jgi:hypothetical protein